MAIDVPKDIATKIDQLHYNSKTEDLYMTLHETLIRGLDDLHLRDLILSRLTTDDMQIILQTYC